MSINNLGCADPHLWSIFFLVLFDVVADNSATIKPNCFNNLVSIL